MSKRRLFREVWNDFDYEYFHPIRIYFIVLWERLCRSLAYARFAWDKYDFESVCMYSFMAFQLQRVKKCMDNGYGVYPKEVNDGIKEAIKICNRLYNEEYDEPYRKIHDKKWGPPRFRDKNGKFDFNLDRKNVKTKVERNRERKESLKCMDDGWKDRMADLDRLHELLKTYQNAWWD